MKIQVKLEFSLRCSGIFYKRMRGRLCNGKWLKNQDFKINLAQRNGSRDLGQGSPVESPSWSALQPDGMVTSLIPQGKNFTPME